MTTISATCAPTTEGWACDVELRDEADATHHAVAVARADLERLAPGASAPDDLVRRSFEFLLAREPKASILRSFELPVIGRYFPDYEREIRG
jgi:hypothetical protein